MAELVQELYDDTFDDAVIADGVVVVDFYADWCGPCKALAPVVSRVAREYAGRVRFGKLNTDGNPATAARFHVSSIPTLIVFRDGRQVMRLGGYQSEAELRRHVDRYVPALPATGAAPAPPARRGALARLLGRR